MCGIVGYVGPDEAYPIVMGSLRRLEYRGYDSAGVAVVDGGLSVHKQAGKISDLAAGLEGSAPRGRLALGHTRWATHGAPTSGNAHPHVDCSGRLAVVHNGIIENHSELRHVLEGRGHTLTSDTDTEVLAHLIEAEMAAGRDLEEAVRTALLKVEGSFAVGVVSADEPARLVAARRDSPLVVGVGDGFSMVASDIPALLEHTRVVAIVEDDHAVDVRPGAITLRRLDGEEVPLATRQIDWDLAAAEKGGYAHFMMKEIHEQPAAVAETVRGRIREGVLHLDELRVSEDRLRAVDKVFVIGCGTSYHAGVVARYAIERWTRLPVEIDIASEFRYRDPVVDNRTLVIGVSQSGETLDTLAAFRSARRMGGLTLAVSNVVDSSMAREADAVLYTHAGPEICVASTKTFLAQMAAMELLGLYLAQERETMAPGERQRLLTALSQLPDLIAEALAVEKDVVALVPSFDGVRDVFFLGRGVGFPVALEGALKLKELAYVRAEGYPAGELKHGPISLIEPGVLVVGTATESALRPKFLSNIQEVKARGATVVLVANDGDTEVEALADHVLVVPRTEEMLSPLVDVVPLQFLAYHMAVRRGCHVDQPRNLAKTVTVE